ncbi:MULTISPECIES: hypothetical protein [Microbacterium]|uniref:DUF2188 domain-containing protein n=1 Tax=Microbacterium wangchenii TaxID=2541726 RepID=A0ABX5SVN2_9MICO|nr:MULTISPECIES: hypothetical protein [Microbacterium]MCK6067812.1 hypothetical protein [Microbacterium sp. EYE_512]QBR89286.1 hypothetical protein E4K62_11720 [Microbacterium wangchenii]TFV81645.1 hypothetical protein E4V99_11720 [Microbacterium sp. dk485]TXK10959.1 hypothetical protein FVP99_16790 [Microbacterium wangchenii]
MTTRDVHTRAVDGAWRVVVEGSPGHSRTFPTRMEALHAGQVLAMVLHSRHLIDDTERSERAG